MVINYNGIRNEIYLKHAIENKHHKLEKYADKLEQWFRVHKENYNGLISTDKYI